jgi:hypothetical protein
MLFQPWKIAIAGAIVYALIWLTAPVSPRFDMDPGAASFIALCYAAFLIGCGVIAYNRKEAISPAVRSSLKLKVKYQAEFFWTLMLLGVAGVSIRFWDQVSNRGVNFAEGAAGAIGTMLLPLCFLPLMLLLCSGSLRSRIPHLIAAVFVFLLPALLGLLILSRSVFMITCLLGYFTLCATKLDGRLLNWRIAGVGAVGLMLLLVGSTAILTQRIEDFGSTFTYSLANSVYAYCFVVDQDAMSSVIRGEPFWSEFYSSVLPNSMYYLGGPYEFTLQWTRPDDQIHSYGLYHFDPYVKGVAALLQIERERLFQEVDLIYRPGAWGSFFTPLWVDFGWFSLLFMFMFGLVTSFIAAVVRSGSVNLMPLYLYFCVVIFLFPVLNLMIAGFGVFTISAFGAFAVLTAGSSASPVAWSATGTEGRVR